MFFLFFADFAEQIDIGICECPDTSERGEDSDARKLRTQYLFDVAMALQGASPCFAELDCYANGSI